jgi:phosphoglycerate dehydrogenase-like enzyme
MPALDGGSRWALDISFGHLILKADTMITTTPEAPAGQRATGHVDVLITGSDIGAEKLAEEARAISPRLRVAVLPGRDALPTMLAEAEIVAGSVPAALLSQAKRLHWLHSWAAGVDVTPEVRASSVIFTSSKGNGAIPLAEHVILLMLMIARKSPEIMQAQRERRWAKTVHGELTGQTLGIIGLGNSGSDLARKAKAFHMRVLGVRRSPARCPDVDEQFPLSELHQFLGQCDWVAMTAPLTPETKHMLGEAEFRAMKPSAYYICISRGATADPDALLRALREEWIAGAGLDAHAVEPLPPDSPFWDAPNTIITPHYGATTQLTYRRGADIFLDNLRRYVNGEPLVNVVDKDAGY